MPIVKIQQKAGQVEIDVIIEKNETDVEWHHLEVISNAGFKWDAPLKIDVPNTDNCGVTTMGPESDEVAVKWDDQIIKQEKLTIAGAGAIISAKYSVQ